MPEDNIAEIKRSVAYILECAEDAIEDIDMYRDLYSVRTFLNSIKIEAEKISVLAKKIKEEQNNVVR